MNFTIGIATDGKSDDRINEIIGSVRKQNINNYEIVIVGNSQIKAHDVKVVPFDESVRPAWITRKKNLITENANFENVVYTHDYLKFEEDWYNGFLKFGNNFDVCMNKMLTPSNKRYRDWTLDAMANILWLTGDERRYERLLPYNENSLNSIMYISGAYWVAKKSFMEKFPLDENLVWGQSEDIEWSYRARNNTQFCMNEFSSVRLIKDKNPSFIEMKPDLLDKFKNLTNEELDIILNSAKSYYEKTFGRPL